MARSLNRVQLIGNLTRDPELRYTPNGNAVCSFGIATNRSWTTESGEKREEAEFHRIVAWNKLAELCSQFLSKGRKVYVEGRLSTRTWNAQDGQQKSLTEIIIDDMIILDTKGSGQASAPDQVTKPVAKKESAAKKVIETQEDENIDKSLTESQVPVGGGEEEVSPDDIPF